MKKILLPVLVSVLFTGCASVVNDTTHPLKLEAKTADGQLVTGAECKVSNDYGTVNAKSGDTVQVRRSSKDLDVTCVRPATPDARARLISRANGGMWGNIIIGGGIGAIIDHNKGTAYTYPTWVQVVFGKLLSFDRRDEKEGSPMNGAEITDGTAPAATSAAAAPVQAAQSAPAAPVAQKN